MKFGTVLLTILFSACALVAVVWLGRSQPISVTEANLEQPGTELSPPPVVSGPQPKAVADETEFEFGQAIVGNEYSHIFTIRNKGEALLTLEKGTSTCQCTVTSLTEGNIMELPPGESVEITMKWRPDEPDELFSHSAEVITNDPKSPIIKFQIHGLVVERIITLPKDVWSMPDILEQTPTRFSGYIFSSALEDFRIEGLKTTNPLLSAEHSKLSKEELSQFRMMSGYRIDLELKGSVPVGPFNESLSIATNVENATTYTLNVRSHRFGPMTMRPIKNSRWNPEKLGIDMGTFAASEGRTSILHLYVRGLDDKDLEFRDRKADPEYLQCALKLDASFSGKGSKRYLLTFKIPPRKPRATRKRANPGRVHLKTNHPEVPEMEFLIHYVSR